MLVLIIAISSCRSYQTVQAQGDPFNKFRATLMGIKPGDQVRITMNSGIKLKGMVIEKEHDRISVIHKKPRDETAILYFKDMNELEKRTLSPGKTALLIASLATISAYLSVFFGL